MTINKLATCLLLSGLSLPTYAEIDRAWLELGMGTLGPSGKIKIANNNWGWSIGLTKYKDEIGGYLHSTEYYDSDTLESFEPKMHVVDISRTWGKAGRFGYIDLSTGLAFANGVHSENCDKNREKEYSGFFSRTTEKLCDKQEGNKVGIPLSATAAFGKYGGLGLQANAFVSDGYIKGQVALIISLGAFTK
ncbi:hypothetical protein [Agaribacterium sp. ZY112]|uniref:hypothetical protein n=1 Tax=Agaribacterium sp. ZY112 TaxID=3233574 RepID=UPI003525E2E8